MAVKTALKNQKTKLMQQYGTHESDSGKTEVQIAILTERINQLNSHFSTHPKDSHSKRGLMNLVSKRKKLLTYLRNESDERYSKILKTLDLRK